MLRSRFREAISVVVFCVATVCVLAVTSAGFAQPAPPSAALSTPDAKQAAALPADIERVLWWLPVETESFLVSRGNVPIAWPNLPGPEPSRNVIARLHRY